MNKITKGYYHCIDCDALFEGETKLAQEHVCPKCGAPTFQRGLALKSKKRSRRKIESPSNLDNKLTIVNKRKSKRELFYMLAAIIVFLMIVAFFFMQGSYSGRGIVSVTDEEKIAQADKQKELEKAKELDVLLPLFRKMMNDFVRLDSPEGVLKCVHDNIRLTKTIQDYYMKEPLLLVGEPVVNILELVYINDVEPIIYGCVFDDDSGESFEAVFIRKGDKATLDWEFYTRYNPVNLKDFIELDDVSEAEFRVYLRPLVLNDELTLVLYSPETDHEGGFDGISSFRISLPVDSEMAESILSTLNDDSGVDQKYRNIIKARTPEGYHRVKVRLRTNPNIKKEERLELVDFIANNWYGIDISNTEEPALGTNE